MCNGQTETQSPRDLVSCLGLPPTDALNNRGACADRDWARHQAETSEPIFPGLPRPIIGGRERQGVTCAAARWPEVQVWPADSSIMARCGAAQLQPSESRRADAAPAAAGRRDWQRLPVRGAASPDRTHPIHTHVSKPGRNPFLENECTRDSAAETDWPSQAIAGSWSRPGIQSRPNVRCMLPEFGLAVDRVEPGSSREQASVGDCIAHTTHTTGLAWLGNPTQATGHRPQARSHGRPRWSSETAAAVGWFAA